jgi:hypothetical protein
VEQKLRDEELHAEQIGFALVPYARRETALRTVKSPMLEEIFVVLGEAVVPELVRYRESLVTLVPDNRRVEDSKRIARLYKASRERSFQLVARLNDDPERLGF